MKPARKREFPLDKIRRYLEPGPIVLVSSEWKGKQNIMTMGWHTVMGFSPSLIGCYIWEENLSHELIKKSGECVINIPTVDLMETAVKIGNISGREVDKFSEFDLTPVGGKEVKAPLIKECFAHFECKVYDAKMVKKYNFFILEVIRAQVATSPKDPKTFHYTGDGRFMLSGEHKSLKKFFREDYL